MLQPIACQQCPLRKKRAFSAVSPQETAFIESFRKRQVSMAAGQEIVREGNDTGDALFTVFSGWAFRYRTLTDGRRQILNFLLPGDFIGLQQEIAGKSAHGVLALTDIILCAFYPERLWDLYRAHPSLGYGLTWLCAHEELIVDENLVSAGRRTALERIAMLLIHLYKRAEALGMAGAQGMLFPLGQQHIADALGLSLVHTNKTLRRLERLGLHRLTNGWLRLGDLAAMQRLADYYALPAKPRPLI